MPKKEIYHYGHDIKSLLLNLSTSSLFVLPFGVYYYREYTKELSLVVFLAFVVAYLAPPMGWLRPHPYSDIPSNKPFAPRMTFMKTSIKQS